MSTQKIKSNLRGGNDPDESKYGLHPMECKDIIQTLIKKLVKCLDEK